MPLKTICKTVSSISCLFSACPIGFSGTGCEKSCVYPLYGKFCQSYCFCPENQCNAAIGCLQGTSACICKYFFIDVSKLIKCKMIAVVKNTDIAHWL